MKQKFIEAFMDCAERFAQLSTATRAKVGAIIVKDNRIISIGYNGMPSGWSNECEDLLLPDWAKSVDDIAPDDRILMCAIKPNQKYCTRKQMPSLRWPVVRRVVRGQHYFVHTCPAWIVLN
jgi:deoxycytidylate deaminase